MPFSEYTRYDGLGLAELVAKKEVSPAELLEAAIAEIESSNPSLNAVIDKLYDRAKERIARGLPEGPFRGVPFLVKDTIALGGEKLSFGSVFLKDNVAPRSHEILDRAEAAGLVILGRTSTSEFGLLPLTECALYGPTKNPYSLAHSAGGSSGGSAAAVAARMVPMAHGNDGGGSIRIPAAVCGLFGLKPSRGRTPGSPLDLPDGFVSENALTRTVRDSAAYLDAIRGPLPGDRWWAPPPSEPYSKLIARDPRRLRIAIDTADLAGVQASKECVVAVEKAARLFASLGHEVEPARPAVDGVAFYEDFTKLWGTMIEFVFRAMQDEAAGLVPKPAKRAMRHRAFFLATARLMTARSRRPPFEPFTLRLAKLAAGLTAAELWSAWTRLQKAAFAVAEFFGRYDLWLTPVLGQPTWRLGSFDPSAPIDVLTEQLLTYAAYTPLQNTAGLPAMSLPLHVDGQGLPVGVQLVAPFGDEATLYQLAAQVERAEPFDRAPRRA